MIVSMYMDSPQLAALSDPLFASTIETDFTDVIEIGFGQLRNEMNICSTVDVSINTTDHSNGFPR